MGKEEKEKEMKMPMMMMMTKGRPDRRGEAMRGASKGTILNISEQSLAFITNANMM